MVDNRIVTFQSVHHQKIIKVLHALNANLLIKTKVYFGGGTVLALDLKEYRYSKGIDFICTLANGDYKTIRSYIYENGYQGLFLPNTSIIIHRGTTDQYGIRLLLEVDNTPIKLEIIAEVRFETDPPRYPHWSPVPCLSIQDSFVSKLLANSDRYMDRSVRSRDLIDLAILRAHHELLSGTIDKAEKSYEVIRPLKDAIQYFQNNPDYREECFNRLQIQKDIWFQIINGLDLLAQDFNLGITSRNFWEQSYLFDSEE